MSAATGYADLWRGALAGRKPVPADYQLGPWVVRLSAHSPALGARIAPAFAHRALPDEADRPVHLQIHLTDGECSPGLPAAPWKAGAVMVNGVVPGFADAEAAVVYDAWSRLLNVIDFRNGLAYFHVPEAARFPSWEVAAPLRVILNLWALGHGGHLLHGAALGDASGAVLLAGPGGSGKSTSALHWISQGGGYLSDDYCLVTAGPPVRVHSLFCSAKVVPADCGNYLGHGIQFGAFDGAQGEKPAVLLHPAFADRLIPGARLKAVLLPRVTGLSGPPQVKRGEGGAAWRALALPTFSQLPGGGRASMEFLSQLVKELPCYHLDLGGPPETVPAVIRQLLLELP